jgi:hypothetical protein
MDFGNIANLALMAVVVGAIFCGTFSRKHSSLGGQMDGDLPWRYRFYLGVVHLRTDGPRNKALLNGKDKMKWGA